MEKILSFLFILLLIYLIFKITFRYVIPWLLKLFVKKMAKKMNANFENQNPKINKKEGEINIDYIPTDRTDDNNSSGGEYVDFEEIK